MSDQPPTLYLQALKLYRRRRVAVRLLLIAATFAAISLPLFPFVAISGNVKPLFFLLFATMLISILSGWMAIPFTYVFALSRCPRCRHRFGFGVLFGNPWASKCVHCGFSIRGRDLGDYRTAEDDPLPCEKCGYNLHKLTTARCPECGTEFDKALLR